MKTKLILFLLIISSLQISAQINIKKCLTTPLVQQELKSNPDYVQGRAKSIAENSTWIAENHTKKSTLNIPIVVHVVHRVSHANVGSGTNISDAQIADALRILNEDYSKTNPEFPNPASVGGRNDFLSYAGNPDLQFCLATTDPSGNTTTGITRTASTKNSFDADTESNDMKKTSSLGKDGWDPSRYLNIWVCNLSNAGGGQTLGYAYLPGLWVNQQWKDGLVVDYQYFGTMGAAAPSNDGRTPTHEIGHYLGLEHTFCESQSGGCCDNDGSNVNDTPAADDDIYWGTVTSTTSNNTCNDLSYSNIFTTNVLDMDENYMSYASTTWMFSVDQVNVMDATLNGYRSSLKNSTVSMNCNSTVGVNEYLLENINIYPNPTLGKLHIDSQGKINKVSISNILGKQIFFTEDFRTNTIDLSSFDNGVYFINISTNKGMHIEKIILSK